MNPSNAQPLEGSLIAGSMPPSEIRRVMDAAWAADGPLIRLEVGEPSFDTPAHIVEAAGRAARAGATRYLPNGGLRELRDALAVKIRERNGYPAEADQTVVTAGGVQGLHATMRVLLDPGDELLLPDPAWPNFSMQAHLLELRQLRYRLTAANSYLPDLDELELLVSPRTKAILLNTPSNPLGVTIPVAAARELVEWAERHGLWILSDEVYDEIVFGDSFISLAAAAPSERIVSLYSFSKVYAMTGWRVGYVVGPDAFARTLTAVQEPLVSCVNAPAQHAALAAISGPQDAVATMVATYRERRDAVIGALAEAGLEATRPDGAFYVWVRVGEPEVPGLRFAQDLLAAENLAVAPGSAFGAEGNGCVRLSLAASEEDLLEGVRRLSRFVRSRKERSGQ